MVGVRQAQARAPGEGTLIFRKEPGGAPRPVARVSGGAIGAATATLPVSFVTTSHPPCASGHPLTTL